MMKVNPRKPVRLKNTSKYWSRDLSRSHVTFSSPASYQSRKIKIEGYETRLYWHYKYCEDNDGQTFYYTLTYNDKSIPNYLGVNCFDYEDLRQLFTGGFRKFLLRKYGTVFKYFVGAELGDGKGSRGFHNNPHYHVLFFLEPDPAAKFPYIKISPVHFRHLVRMYWQGFDQDVDGYHDFKDAKFGIAKEGDNCGLVYSFKACCYCAKYVCKDAFLKQKEVDFERLIRSRLKSELQGSAEFHNWFFRTVVWKWYNVPLNAKNDKWIYPTASALFWHLCPDCYDECFHSDDLTSAVLAICHRFDFWKHYNDAFKEYLDLKVKEAINVYRNRYCNKCRISHGVGDYALKFISDNLNPVISVPCKDGFKNRPISMYYYRKLFTDVHIDRHGSPIRVLNETGVRYKLKRLDSQIDKMSERAYNDLQLVLNNAELYEKMRSSDVNVNVLMHHSDFVRYYERVSFTNVNIFKSYAVYKLVYEDRFFPFDFTGNSKFDGFPVLDYHRDYERFLQPSFFTVSRSDIRLDLFFENGCPDSLPYSQHPVFLRFLGIFNVFDLCADYFFVQDDLQNQKLAEEVESVRRFHVKREMSISLPNSF